MTAPDVNALLTRLAAVGVGLSLNEAGDGLTLSGTGQPPAALLEAVRAAKPELLALLRAAKEEASSSFAEVVAHPHNPAPDMRAAEVVTGRDNLSAPSSSSSSPDDLPPAPEERPVKTRPAPDWAALALEAGRCGSCERFTLSPDWGPYMGECDAVSRAWWPDAAPLSIHMAHACPLEGAAGYRARDGGKFYSLAPTAAHAVTVGA